MQNEGRAQASNKNMFLISTSNCINFAYIKEEIVGRLVVTKYPNDSNAYIGFFECIDDIRCR